MVFPKGFLWGGALAANQGVELTGYTSWAPIDLISASTN